MADQPKTTGETTPTTDDKDDLVQPDSINPHIVPEKASGEEKAADDA